MTTQTVVYEYFCIDGELDVSIKCRFDANDCILPEGVKLLPDGGLKIEDAMKACDEWTRECEEGFEYEIVSSSKKEVNKRTSEEPAPMGVEFGGYLAQKVIFKKVIDEDSFTEKGMMAWLTCIEWDDKYECYDLWFDFSEFEERNAKYFRKVFHYNDKLVTAHERGAYSPKCSTFFSTSSSTRDDAAFNREIQEYLHLVEVDSMK